MKANIPKKKKTSVIESGMTLYDLNKDLIKKSCKVLTETEVRKKLEEAVEKYTNTFDLSAYAMLLCGEQKDYTIFECEKGYTCKNKKDILTQELFECLINRSKSIYSISFLDETGAIEIWLEKYNINEELGKDIFCYYFFPYDSAIIHI